VVCRVDLPDNKQLPGGKMEIRAAASVVNQVQFKEQIDDKKDRNAADKADDRDKRDDSRAVNKSNADKRAAQLAASRGGVDIRA
jgi:hypothetical protein